MKSIVAYIRSLLGLVEESSPFRTSFKRDRADDELSSDDEVPPMKKQKQMQRTSYPGAMASHDPWEKEETPSKNVRLVPIQIEASQPSTSTPIESSTKFSSRVRTVPIKLVGVSENGPGSPLNPLKPRMHTPVRPVIHAVVEDDDEPEVTWIENKSDKSTVKQPKLYINLEDEEDLHRRQEDDVIFVKKVSTGSPGKPYKIFLANDSSDVTDCSEDPVYYRLKKNDKRSLSPRTYSKFKTPAGIRKLYKKAPTPVPKWMQTGKSTNLSNPRSKLLGVNGNTRSTLSDIFNLDEKRNYQDLIRRVSESMKRPGLIRKPIDIIDLAGESAAFRHTLRSQKRALNEIKLVEKGLAVEKENDTTKEYDPITVASINSSDSEVEVVPSDSSTTSSVKIDPVNTLRDSFKGKAVLSEDWLARLDSKYRKKKQDTQEKLKEARRESDIISKVNSEQKIAHLEHKLKYELSIPESLFLEAPPTAELPPLTPEQERIVNKAMGPGPSTQVMVEKFNLRITRRDIQTLAGLNWLNDEVINFYMNLLIQRSEERQDLPKVYAMNTFFYTKLMQTGQAGLRRWTRKVDIFSHELIVVPVHLGVHWCLSLVDFRSKTASYLDSMGGRNQACLDALLRYLRDEHQDKKGQPFDDSGWTTKCLSKIPQQMNGSDCGMFACTFAEFASRNAPFSFTQAHMPYLRRKAALEILSGRLLL